MINILIITLIISLIVNVYQWYLHSGKIKDRDRDFIPDNVERKARRVKKELNDVKKAFKK